MHTRIWQHLLCGCLTIGLLSACGDTQPPATPAPPPLAKELVFYDWVDDLPQSVLGAFTKEYGVKVNYVTFESQEEAVENIRSGKIYDVAVLESDQIPRVAAAGQLAEIDFRQIPNFKNVSANFRDLATDPGNRHTVPYHYGTTGLLVRTDLIGNAVTRWADLWDPRYAGKVALRAQPRELVALTLLSMGYSLNSENPLELDAALERLLELKKAAFFVEVEAASAVPRLLSGEAVILHGWAEDHQVAHAENPAVTYVLPEEGTAFWGDNFVIPASSPHPYTAEVFINFLLRPEISAQIVNEKKYATANEVAHPLIKPEIRDDPVIFPPVEMLRRAYFYTPLSPEGETLYRLVWERFLAGDPGIER
jgi:spermidine/putrescine transport system substrate-binding protein